MLIYPAIDLYEGCAVRLYKGDYAQKTVYHHDPLQVASDFVACGATHIHLVDLEGAKTGGTPNLEQIVRIKQQTGLFCEAGGGIRSLEVIERYINAGIDRVILGSAAVTQPDFAQSAVRSFGDHIAIGVDIKDGFVAIHGWTEKTQIEAYDFCRRMEGIGISTMICTDISKDGAMQGTNRELYRDLSKRVSMQIIASGGVSSMDDIRALRQYDLYGAIVGKAYYTGAISLKEAIREAQ